MKAALTFQGVSKSFAGVEVLKRVTFGVPEGATLGLVGENGAGKSTLMNILGGHLRADSGSMALFGRTYEPRRSHDATAAGVAMIHQELNLFPNLTVAENLFLTRFQVLGGWIRRGPMREHARRLLAEVGLNVPPDMRVERLSAGERQLVEIAKALATEPRLLLLDEPTTSLTARESERLFDLLEGLKKRGLTMIYISHALKDVLRLCDRVVVLRDGEITGEGARGEFSEDRMIQDMVGRRLETLFPVRSGAPGTEPLLELDRVTRAGTVRDIRFTVRRSEILGIAGLMGSGRTELARIVFGLDPLDSGTVRLNGESLNALSPCERIARGLAFLTEDRRDEGLCMEGSIQENLTLASLSRWAKGRFGFLADETIRDVADKIRADVALTPAARLTQPVRILSGGNQQKVVLAKWLLCGPKVLLLDEPTRGIDVGAKHEVYRLIQAQADRGAGVLVISSEIEELMGLCDRILVMNRGEIRDEIPRAAFDRERILRSALWDRGATRTEAPVP